VLRGVALHKMIKTFAHKGIEAFFRKGTRAGIQAPRDMNLPGWRLHPLSGDLDGHWSVTVSGNWRLTFLFDDGDAILVNYQDCH